MGGVYESVYGLRSMCIIERICGGVCMCVYAMACISLTSGLRRKWEGQEAKICGAAARAGRGGGG